MPAAGHDEHAAPAATGLPTAGAGGDPRVPQVMAQIAPGWIFVGRSARLATMLLQPSDGPNPLADIAEAVSRRGRSLIVDAMSSFGAIPIDFTAAGIDFLVSSANKCIEGVPGFCFVICRGETLAACEGYARSLSLDLLGQLKGFRANGQFRFTPPTHGLLAFDQALNELDSEGGVAARSERYRRLQASWPA